MGLENSYLFNWFSLMAVSFLFFILFYVRSFKSVLNLGLDASLTNEIENKNNFTNEIDEHSNV